MVAELAIRPWAKLVISERDLYWARPVGDTRVGVLVLAGSSGRIDQARADLLASAGATALAIRWFGGPYQPACPREVPLETFVEAISLLEPGCERVCILGSSYGAEAALLTAIRDLRVSAVAAFAPTDVVWEGHLSSREDPPISKWSWGGEPLPFVPLDRRWTPDGARLAFTRYYERSRVSAGEQAVVAARIPLEMFSGDVMLVAGGDDQVWPSVPAARAIKARRDACGLKTVLVEDPDAGHQVLLPGEASVGIERSYATGGDAESSQRLGRTAWPALVEIFGLSVESLPDANG